MLEALKKSLEIAEKQKEMCFEALQKAKAEDFAEAQKNLVDVLESIQKLQSSICDIEAKQKGVTVHEDVLSEEQKEQKTFLEAIKSAYTTGTGSVLVPTGIAATIERKRYEYSNFRRYATVHPATGDYVINVEGNGVEVNYVAANGAIPESNPTTTGITLTAYKLAALVKVANEQIADSVPNLVQYITDMIAKGLALKEDAEILKGTGAASSHITGVLTRLAAESTAKKTTTASATAITWEEVKKMLSSLGAYKQNAILVMNQDTADLIHNFKGANNAYIFPQDQELTSIMGHRVVINSAMDSVAASKVVIVAGDFSYYHLADRQGIRVDVSREYGFGNDQTAIRGIERVDGNLTQVEAFAELVCKAS